MQRNNRIHLGMAQSMRLLAPFALSRIFFQLRLVAFISLYMLGFHFLILRSQPHNLPGILGGLAAVVFGLALFLEGIMMAVMPLGEFCGKRLPGRIPLGAILVFGFILGIVTTFAEPAINILQSAGSSVRPWDAPLLYAMLNRFSFFLVLAVGVGVGLAVVAGFLKFIYSTSLKPFIYATVPVLAGLTLYALTNPNLRHLTGLAWDCGAITTGPVTVPLVIALGLGISRVVSGTRTESGGFGVVTLASAFPVIAVLLLGIVLQRDMPSPAPERSFFASEAAVISVFGSREAALQYAQKHCSTETVAALSGTSPTAENGDDTSTVSSGVATRFAANAAKAAQAVLPLTLILLLAAALIIRTRIPDLDLMMLGTVLALAGFALFGFGMETGLARMGGSVGARLPAAYTMEHRETVLRPFSTDMVRTAISPDAAQSEFFFLADTDGIRSVPFDPARYNAASSEYRLDTSRPPLYGRFGYLVAILFAVVTGYFATIAEPALIALGIKLEEITAGSFRRSLLVHSVAVGVGLGMAVGVLKILLHIPLAWIVIPLYALLLLITAISSEEFIAVAWDSAGVTTGPITVPLVAALGIGLGASAGVVEGFGILAAASGFPILSVLVTGLVVSARRRRLLAGEAAQ